MDARPSTCKKVGFLKRAAACAAVAVAVLACLMVSPLLTSSEKAGRAFAETNANLVAQSADLTIAPQSSGFKASTYYLDLSPKVQKVPYGHKYIRTHKTVTINIPSGYYPVTWKSSNPKVATAKDSYRATEMRLTVYGNAHGTSTITVTNAATFETVKIKVVVNGYNSKSFKASKTKLNLSPKKKKISGGYKYTAKSSSITIAAPDGATMSWKSSDPSVADAKWSNKWVGNTMKLKVTGHRRGAATITVTNSKTKKKVKVKVTVGGYGLGLKWNDQVKKTYTKSDGTKGRYWLDNFTLINKTGKKVTLDANSTFRYWALNPYYDEEYEEWLMYDEDFDDEPQYYAWKNRRVAVRGVPITISKNAKKRVYIGEKQSEIDDSYWNKGILTVKVGKAYRTIYVNSYGMVTKVLNGKDK